MGITASVSISLRALWYPLAIVVFIAAGFYVRRSVLNFGFLADDYAQQAMLDGAYPLQRAPFDLFDFSDGTPAETHRLMDSGFYPWWTDPELRLVMLRPLASLMIWFDHKLFGHEPYGYHVHSALWSCLMLLVIAASFRRMLSPLQAALASLIVVCSAAQMAPMLWICNRSALTATTFSLLALMTYREGRLRDKRSWLFGAALLYAIGLAFGEYAFCMFGYFVAYELFCVREAPRERLRLLLFPLTPVLLFLVIRGVTHSTVRHSGIYLDPAGEPFEFIRAALVRFPVMIGDLLLILRSDAWTIPPPWVNTWVERGWLSSAWLTGPEPWQQALVCTGYVACVFLAGFYWVIRRSQRLRALQWLLVGSVLSLIPVLSSFPSSRLLLIPMIGFSAVFAASVLAIFGDVAAKWRRFDWGNALAAAAAAAFLAYHLAIPLWQQWIQLELSVIAAARVRGAVMHMPVDDSTLPNQDLVILGAIEGNSSMYLPAMRRVRGLSVPRRCLLLSWVPSGYTLTRLSERAFRVRFGGGTVFARSAAEQMLRALNHRMQLHETIDVGIFRATVNELYDGFPKSVTFEFDRALESDSLVFMLPRDHGFQRIQLPATGSSIEIPRADVPLWP